MTKALTIALAGNPNCGKTALFNALTGSSQRVGNWPGVTVDRKMGAFVSRQHQVSVVDLPGTYSISVISDTAIDEKIACEYLLSGEADVIVNVIDGSNLVRNLYLTLQLLEMNIPVVLAVNMIDIVEKRGIQLDLKALSQSLGCLAVPLVASRGHGVEALKEAVIKVAAKKKRQAFQLPMGSELQATIDRLAQAMQERSNAHWLALRLLENDNFASQQVGEAVVDLAKATIKATEKSLGEDPDILIADARYTFATDLSDKVTQLKKTSRQTVTQWIDRIVLNRYLGIPIFFAVMYLMFVFAINVGGAFQDFFDMGSDTIFIQGTAHLLASWHAPAWLIALLAHGFGQGINTVITFAPVIGAMFLFLAFLEDCGYMARAAFVMDRFMQAVGLPGKSFVPMIVGFGCNVPAVMGARTLSNRRDRVLTVMMVPFMSCGARLAIFAVFASAFFPAGGENVIFLLYLTGIAVAVLTGLVLRKTFLPGKPAPMVMELPAYHVPRISVLCRHAWMRLRNFLVRAGKYIVPICVLIGALGSITVHGKLAPGGSQHSVLSAAGRAVTPIFAPMGVKQDNWPATVGLATGVLAKEVVVGTLDSLYTQLADEKQEADTFHFWQDLLNAVESIPENLASLGGAFANPIAADEAPHDMSKTAYGQMVARFDGRVGAFAYLLFVLLYFPCVSTMAAMRREVNARWAVFSLSWSTCIAYGLSVFAYQAMTFERHAQSSLLWCTGVILLLGLTVFALRRYAKG